MHNPQNKPCFIIAEAGVNHNGSLEIAHKLIDIAADAKADAVKFQTFNSESLARPGAAKAAYQQKDAADVEDQQSMLKNLELPTSAYLELIAHCRVRDIQFMSTPFDEESAEMLINLGMSIIKIPSGEITNLPFIRFLAEFGLSIVLSTGMSTLDEVDEAIKTINAVWEAKNISNSISLTLLHCTSNYPAASQDVNLKAMHTLGNRFGLPVGYSDHTLGTMISVAAVALGATIIEKHFTLDCAMEGPDHRASLSPSELHLLVAQIRQIELALGDGVKKPTQNELPIRDIARRSVTLIKPVKAGQLIQPDMLTLMRPGTGISPKHLHDLVGKRYKNNMPAWTTLTWEDVEA
jgi:N,N'-diacetyllegionaminate synthase